MGRERERVWCHCYSFDWIKMLILPKEIKEDNLVSPPLWIPIVLTVFSVQNDCVRCQHSLHRIFVMYSDLEFSLNTLRQQCTLIQSTIVVPMALSYTRMCVTHTHAPSMAMPVSHPLSVTRHSNSLENSPTSQTSPSSSPFLSLQINNTSF